MNAKTIYGLVENSRNVSTKWVVIVANVCVDILIWVAMKNQELTVNLMNVIMEQHNVHMGVRKQEADMNVYVMKALNCRKMDSLAYLSIHAGSTGAFQRSFRLVTPLITLINVDVVVGTTNQLQPWKPFVPHDSNVPKTMDVSIIASFREERVLVSVTQDIPLLLGQANVVW